MLSEQPMEAQPSQIFESLNRVPEWFKKELGCGFGILLRLQSTIEL